MRFRLRERFGKTSLSRRCFLSRCQNLNPFFLQVHKKCKPCENQSTSTPTSENNLLFALFFLFLSLPSAVFTWTNLLVVVVELDAEESEALDVVPLVTSSVLNEQQLIVGVVVVVDPGVVPINSRGEKQRMHLRDGFLGDQLDPIYVAYNMQTLLSVLHLSSTRTVVKMTFTPGLCINRRCLQIANLNGNYLVTLSSVTRDFDSL